MPTLATCLTMLACAAPAAEQPLERFEARQRHMGVEFKLAFYAPDEATADRAQRAAFARIKQLDGILSDYAPTSELSRLSATAPSPAPVPLGNDLWRVLSASQALASESEGAFDVTVGPLTALWRQARRGKKLPADEALSAARAATGYRHLALDEKAHTARLLRPGMRLDLGGIGMGYAVDQALAVLRREGIPRAMIDASGDIGAADPPPGARGWRVGVAPLDPQAKPSQFLLLANRAVTTSGDAFQHVVIDGRRYSHIVDPRTGLGLGDSSSVTVVANDCTTADSLATAVCVLGPTAGLKLVESRPGAAALVVRKRDDGRVETRASRRWAEHLEGRP